MKKLVLAFLMIVSSAIQAHALTTEFGITENLEFVATTQIPSEDQQNLTLCYVTSDFLVFGYPLTSDIQRYALSDDRCATENRPFSSDQLTTAQSLDLIAAYVPAVARNDLERNLKTYGLLVVVGLGLFAVIWRRMKSLLGFDPTGQMRKKASLRILSVMCHAAKCDGLVGSKEIALIGRATRRLTRRSFSTADIIRTANHVTLDLGTKDYIAFGKGLRDREKDMMLHAALLVTTISGRMLPAEYEFVTELAFGMGMPGEDFRRVLGTVTNELGLYATSP